MRRTQLYLDDEECTLLDRAAAHTGASKSELVRRAIREQYGRASATARLAALHRSAGAWQEQADTGADYVEHARGDVNDRLAGLGMP